MDAIQLVREAADYMYGMCGEPLTVPDIAAQVYLSPSYFAGLFRAVCGYTVKNYLNRCRLCRAAKALLETELPVSAVAYQFGFSSQQAFTRCFKELYGIPPAGFRRERPQFDPFPPESLWKERIPSMELEQCFEKVSFIHKEPFFVMGYEVDIDYRTEHGTDPISEAWRLWKENALLLQHPDLTEPGVSYGITHSETARDTGKYIACVEVNTLESLPAGLVGRRFEGCGYAVFETTMAIIETGDFWRTFYAKWLPQSGYQLPDESLHDSYCTFARYPAIEVYGREHQDEQSPMWIYAPVVRT